MTLKATHFSASSGLEMPAHEVHGGSTGFISWQRLAGVLRTGGELRPDEGVISFQVDDRGLSFRVETRIR
jgi:hypothetical protein